MSDRIQALTVVLESDVREEDIDSIIRVLEGVRGVAKVTDKGVVNVQDLLARQHVRNELATTLFEVFDAVMDGRKVTVQPRQTR